MKADVLLKQAQEILGLWDNLHRSKDPAWEPPLGHHRLCASIAVYLKERDEDPNGPNLDHKIDALTMKVHNQSIAFDMVAEALNSLRVDVQTMVHALAAEEEDPDLPITDLEGQVAGKAREPGQSLG